MEISDVFLAQQGALRRQADNAARAQLQLDQREWALPAGITGSLTHPLTLEAPLSRRQLNETYQRIMNNEGSVGDAAACRIQADYLAAQERALRLRHASSLRCAMHSASRRAGQALPGGVFDRVTDYVQGFIHEGTAT